MTVSTATRELRREQAELLARQWLTPTSLLWPHEAEIAGSEQPLSNAERMQLADPLMQVVRALFNRSGE